MLLPVLLLLLSLSTVRCGECDWREGRESFENMKSTIDTNIKGFRTVFPRDYRVVHHYKDSMLCADRCCVFPAAVVLLDSWQTLLTNLYDEHLNHSLIIDIKQSLDDIIKKHPHIEIFQEENDLSKLPKVNSTPEELLTLTSQLLSKWLNVSCDSSIKTCPPIPTLAPAEWTIYTAPRARLLTTREVHIDVPAERLSNGGPPSALTLPPVSAWILLLLWGCHLLL